MNKVNIIGRLTDKPELRYTNSNIANTKVTIAVNRNFTNAQGEKEADFIRCVAWKKTAELICEYFDKGSQIGVSGRIQTGSFDDKEGKKVFTTDLVIEEIDFIDKKGNTPKEEVKEEVDCFADFGNSIEISDDFLE